jgi:hypothetical protein
MKIGSLANKSSMMKFVQPRPYADPEAAARKLMEIANSIEPVQDGRIHIELINWPFLQEQRGFLAWCCGDDLDLFFLGLLGFAVALLLAFGHVGQRERASVRRSSCGCAGASRRAPSANIRRPSSRARRPGSSCAASISGNRDSSFPLCTLFDLHQALLGVG